MITRSTALSMLAATVVAVPLTMPSLKTKGNLASQIEALV